METGPLVNLLGIAMTLIAAIIGYQWRLSQRVTRTEAQVVPGVNEKLAALGEKLESLDRKQDDDRQKTAADMAKLRDEIKASETRTEKALDKLDANIGRVHDRLDQIITALPPPPVQRRTRGSV
jgi:DNA repair exonuclease SbcCD ATPase subunit